MAKQRYINTKMWRDGYFNQLDPIEKLLFVYLLTNPDTNISGIYELPLKIIATDTGLDSEMVKKILLRFEKDHKVKFENGWVAIKNFIKHQSLNPKILKGISEELKKAPQSLYNFINIDEITLNTMDESFGFKRKPIRPKIRAEVLARDEYRCVFCGKTSKQTELEVDHINPVSEGGGNDINNLRTLCTQCNCARNGFDERDYEKSCDSLSHLNTNTNLNSNSNTNYNLDDTKKTKQKPFEPKGSQDTSLSLDVKESSLHKKITDKYFETWSTKNPGIKPKWGGREGKELKAVIDRGFTETEIITAMEIYYYTKDPFLISQGYTASYLFNNIDKILSSAQAKKDNSVEKSNDMMQRVYDTLRTKYEK